MVFVRWLLRQQSHLLKTLSGRTFSNNTSTGRVLRHQRRSFVNKVIQTIVNVKKTIQHLPPVTKAAGVAMVVSIGVVFTASELQLLYTEPLFIPGPSMGLPPPFDEESRAEYIIEKEMQFQLPFLLKQVCGMIGTAQNDDGLEALAALVRYYKLKKGFDEAIGLCEKALKNAKTISTRTEIEGHLAILNASKAGSWLVNDATARSKALQAAQKHANAVLMSKEATSGGKVLARDILLSVAIQTNDVAVAQELFRTAPDSMQANRAPLVQALSSVGAAKTRLENAPKHVDSMITLAEAAFLTHDLKTVTSYCQKALEAAPIPVQLLECVALDTVSAIADDSYINIYGKLHKRLKEVVESHPSVRALELLCKVLGDSNPSPTVMYESVHKYCPDLDEKYMNVLIGRYLASQPFAAAEYLRCNEKLGEHFLQTAFKSFSRADASYFLHLAFLYNAVGKSTAAVSSVNLGLQVAPANRTLMYLEALLNDEYQNLLPLLVHH